MARGIIGGLKVYLGLDSAALERGANEAEKRMQSLQKNWQRMGRKMTDVGRTWSLAVTAPILAFGALAAKTAGDFEFAMNRVGAVSGATTEELEQLRDTAKELGRTTQFTASQAADALSFLAIAGFRANESMEALPGTLQLAAAAQMDLGRTADIVSNVLTGYNKEVAELGAVNDVLVKAFTSTNTNLEQLGEALKYAGPVASAAGVRFEEAAAALGLMGNAGIQGSMAGTSLRGAIARILSPTAGAAAEMRNLGLAFTDTSGRLLPLADIIEQLGPHAEDAGLFMRLFGQRAGPAMAALASQGAEALRELDAELQKSGGTAERIAEAQMKGFNGAMLRLKSAFEGLQIAIAESGLLDFLARMMSGLASLISKMGEFSPTTLKVVTVLGMLAAAAGPVLWIAGSMVTSFASLLPVMMKLPAVFGAVKVAMLALLANPVLLGAAAVIGGIVAAWYYWDDIVEIVSRVYQAVKTWMGDKLSALWETIKGAVRAYFDLYLSLPAAALNAVRAMVIGVQTWIKDKLTAVWDWAIDKIEAVKRTFADLYTAVVGNSYIPDMVDGIGREMDRLDDEMVRPAEQAANAVKRTFADAADATLSAFDRIAGSLRRGGFLDILGAGLDLGMQLGSIGAFGKKVSTTINSPRVPAYAGGTSFHPGGMALVGERGPELVNLPRGAQVFPNGSGPGGNTYHFTGNLMTEEFWRQIQAGDIAAADAGSRLGVSRVRQAGAWQLR